MAIQSTQVGGGDTSILEVPAGKSWAVTAMLFCNVAVNPQEEIYTEGGDSYLDVHLCASGAAAGVDNMVLNNIPIPAGETFTFNEEKIILEAGDIIRASSTSPTNITATISYMEV